MGKRERSQTITMNKKEDKNDLRKAYISSHFYINVKLGTPENTQL